MNIISHGDQFRQAMVEDIRGFEKTMDKAKELRISVFTPKREIYFILAHVGSADIGFINLFGETEDGELVNLSMHYTLVAYQLHAVPAEEPRRIGFNLR